MSKVFGDKLRLLTLGSLLMLSAGLGIRPSAHSVNPGTLGFEPEPRRIAAPGKQPRESVAPPVRAICRDVSNREPAIVDRPDPRAAAALRGCSAQQLYYAPLSRRDPVRARLCALSAGSDDDTWIRHLVLMNIYANGEGAPRDLDLALHHACGLEGADNQWQLRIGRLDRMRKEGWTGRDFDFCQDTDIVPMLGGSCPYYSARVNEERRATALRQLTADWTDAERLALDRLQTTKAVYVSAHVSATHGRGTPAGTFFVESAEEVEDAFLEQVRMLASGRIPTYSLAQIRETQRAALAQYHASQRTDADEIRRPHTAEEYRQADRAWRHYRDAFIDLAQLGHPGLSRERLTTWLLRARPASARDYGQRSRS